MRSTCCYQRSAFVFSFWRNLHLRSPSKSYNKEVNRVVLSSFLDQELFTLAIASTSIPDKTPCTQQSATIPSFISKEPILQMAKTRSQTASRASVMRVARAANTATPRRQRSAGKASTTNNQRRLPRIILRLGPPPIAAEEALSIARHDRQVGRPHIILRLNRAPAAGLEFQAIARPGARLHIILRMGLRPTAAEELEALSRHDRLRGRQPANTGMGRAPRMVALGKVRSRFGAGR